MKMTLILDAFKTEETNNDTFTELLKEHKKFILVCAYRACGHYVSTLDDEWSIALMAFYEACRTYEDSKGNFKSFCSLVIRRRILDYQKGIYRYQNEIPVDRIVLDGELDENPLPLENEIHMQLAKDDSQTVDYAIKGEIEEIQMILEEYGFSFYDLSSCSPKSIKTKKTCTIVIREMMNHSEWMKYMRKNRALPMKELCISTRIHRKIIERHRRYIITALEIKTGDYPYLSEYIPLEGDTR